MKNLQNLRKPKRQLRPELAIEKLLQVQLLVRLLQLPHPPLQRVLVYLTYHLYPILSKEIKSAEEEQPQRHLQQLLCQKLLIPLEVKDL